MSIASIDKYGMNVLPRPGQYKNICRCKELGMRWARIDIPWDTIEPRKGSPTWATLDTHIGELRKQGFQILACISYTPAWANGGGNKTLPPVDANTWRQFIKQALNKYGAFITHWSIWNEPNLKEFYTGSIPDYINKILIPGIDTIKGTNKNYKIVGPDTAHSDKAWDKWMSAALKNAGGKIDIISHHIYENNITRIYNSLSASLDGIRIPLTKPPLRSVISDCGFGSKPVWITELGWPSNEVGEKAQADNHKDSVKLLENKRWIEKAFYFELTEDPSWKRKFGILRDSTPKPAFNALKVALTI